MLKASGTAPGEETRKVRMDVAAVAAKASLDYIECLSRWDRFDCFSILERC